MGVHNVAYALSSVIYHTFYAWHADKRGNDFLVFAVYQYERNGSRVYGNANVFGAGQLCIDCHSDVYPDCRSYE